MIVNSPATTKTQLCNRLQIEQIQCTIDVAVVLHLHLKSTNEMTCKCHFLMKRNNREEKRDEE